MARTVLMSEVSGGLVRDIFWLNGWPVGSLGQQMHDGGGFAKD